MADVFSTGKRRRCYIYLPQALPYLLTASQPWPPDFAGRPDGGGSGIGVPEGSIGEKLYHAKIYLNTPDLFAWTLVIITISFLFEKCFLWGLGRIIQWIERTQKDGYYCRQCSKSYGDQAVLKKLAFVSRRGESPASWAHPGAERLRLCGFFLD